MIFCKPSFWRTLNSQLLRQVDLRCQVLMRCDTLRLWRIHRYSWNSMKFKGFNGSMHWETLIHLDSIGNNPKQHEQNCLNSDNANILKMLRSRWSSAKVLEQGFGTAAGLLRRRARRIPSDQPDQPAISAMLINVYQCCICCQWNANGAVSDCFCLWFAVAGCASWNVSRRFCDQSLAANWDLQHWA